MRGGNQKHFLESTARFAALAAVLGMFSNSGYTLNGAAGCAQAATSTETAAETVDNNCGEPPTNEKSILVSKKDSSTEENTAEGTTEGDTADSLQPIAMASKNEPDLAEPLPEPTLAEPMAEPAGEVVVSDLDQPVEPADLAEIGTPSEIGMPTEIGEIDESIHETGVMSFHGVVAGSTRRGELLQAWGEPLEEDTAGRVLSFQFERIPMVRVALDGDLVETLIIKLGRPLSAVELIEKLGLEDVRPAVLADDAEQLLAEVFPERGVLFRFQAGDSVSDRDSAKVIAVVIQPPRAAAYLLRAENNLGGKLSDKIADIEEALRLDHRSAHARWLLSQFYLTTGQAVDAERLAAESVESEPENHAYRMQWAKCLRQMARYDRAVKQIRQVLESSGVEPIVRAQALHEMGLLAGIGSKETARRAAPLHGKAIEIADALASSSDRSVSLAAGQLLVEAHLAMAQQIAQGDWSQQDKVVPQWIGRASALAENLIAEDRRHLPLRLQIAVSALAATAHMNPPIDPQLWILEAEQTATKLRKSTEDSLAIAQIDWQLGLAYFHSAQIEYRRGNPDEALRLGYLADEQLADLASDRDELPDTSYVLGDLYFQIGAVHAVHLEDHESACEWYYRAAARMLQPVPVTTIATPKRHGEALVSMGVSYWHTGDRERAIALTQAGVDLIEQAVESGLLAADSLLVPYGNLSAMYEARGDATPAAKYTELASKLDAGQPSTTTRR